MTNKLQWLEVRLSDGRVGVFSGQELITAADDAAGVTASYKYYEAVPLPDGMTWGQLGLTKEPA
jgi:hypothetical protein